jgi:hypothetical protein
VEAEPPRAAPIKEGARKVVATVALSWIGIGIQGRALSAARREGADSAVKRTRGAWDGPPVGFGLDVVALGDSPAGSDPAFEKRLRKRCERSSITIRKASRHKGRGGFASVETH